MCSKSKLDSATPSSIKLISTRGSKQRGGMLGGEAWLVTVEGKRVGTAYINIVEDSFRGKHASFHIFLNKPNQGRKIGRVVYELVCSYSQHDIIYAHMRKSNIASHKAAVYAGFVNATFPEETQLVLVWLRQSKESNDA